MLTKLIIMFILGFICAFALMMIVVISIYFDDERNLYDYPTDDDMDQMCLWYDEQYKGDHEK